MCLTGAQQTWCKTRPSSPLAQWQKTFHKLQVFFDLGDSAWVSAVIAAVVDTTSQ